ncbi:hypothetical protein OJAV_G00113660 [Oryzias javanicus]|uniref:C-type lectin domain-containing protein n=1 Tax=Oryzias javanicus TaxID=123683 RepID=A0A3S2UB64_ORYJA|nr:hypothetical protein OJAV_G00113660 [Oryzias javanicus]
MSTETEAAADLRVKFNRNLHQDGREQSEVEMIEDEDQISDHGLQQTDKQKQQKLQAERRNWFRVLKLSLGVFFFLFLAGLMTHYLLLSLENNKINDYNHLLTELTVINKTLIDETNQLKNKIEGQRCPELWMRFRSSCYYKSIERKTWTDSRSFCLYEGADLLVINSREEQEFVFKLTPNKESWIGLSVYSSYPYGWRWVNGSPLTETFWDETLSRPSSNNYAVVLSDEGKVTQQYNTYIRNWICEK